MSFDLQQLVPSDRSDQLEWPQLFPALVLGTLIIQRRGFPSGSHEQAVRMHQAQANASQSRDSNLSFNWRLPSPSHDRKTEQPGLHWSCQEPKRKCSSGWTHCISGQGRTEVSHKATHITFYKPQWGCGHCTRPQETNWKAIGNQCGTCCHCVDGHPYLDVPKWRTSPQERISGTSAQEVY